MLNIMNYELKRRWKFFLGAFVLLMLGNGWMMYDVIGLDAGAFDSKIKFSISFLKEVDVLIGYIGLILGIVLGIIGIILAIDHISRMYKTLFTDESYLIFSIPQSGYGVLGGKVLSVVVEVLGFILLGGILAWADYTLIIHHFQTSSAIGSMMQQNIAFVFKIASLFIIYYIVFFMSVTLSMTLVKSIFVNVKHSIILSFISFIVLTNVVSTLLSFISNTTGVGETLPITEIHQIIMPIILLGSGLMVLYFGVTGYLFDKKINL